MISLYFEIAIFSSFLLISYLWGLWLEKKIDRSIAQDEFQLKHVIVDTCSSMSLNSDYMLVSSTVVLGQGYFKQFLTAIKSFFGGKMNHQIKLLNQARRMAILRLKKQACALNAQKIINLRFETIALSGVGSAAAPQFVLCYGTLVKER